MLRIVALMAAFQIAGAAVVWQRGSKTMSVAVSSDGSYSVHLTAGAASTSEWLKGGVNQTIVAPVELTAIRTTSGSQGRLGAFSAVELSVASKPTLADPDAQCGALEQDTDYYGNDIRFINNITDPTKCCALCLAEKACAGFTLMGAADAGKAWAKRCYLKSAMTHSMKYNTHISAKIPGREPAPAPPGPAPPPPAPPLPPGTVISLVFTIKYFAELELFLFEQQWLDGLELQYTTRSGLAAAFPLFDTASASTLSAISWSNEMSGGEVCHADPEATSCVTTGGSKAASGFGEGNDAPLVLLNGSTAATDSAAQAVVVLSAFDKFGHQRSQVIEAGGRTYLGWGPDLSLAPAAAALPKGYNSSSALFSGVGGVNHVMHEWGQTMQAAYGTKRKTAMADDALTSRVGYWTDNVAFYDWYNYPDIGSKGIPEDVFHGLSEEFDKKFPFKMAYWEYDVNYKMRCEPNRPGGVAGNCNMNCIYNWTYSNSTWNPSGLQKLGKDINANWMFYLHMYCADSPMWKRFPSINSTEPMNFWGHSGVTYAQPAPSASFAFYDYLLSWGESVGETAVFSDFLGDQTSIQQMNMGFERDEVRDWLLGFDQATLKHHMTMQMCMQLPSNLMQSLEMDSVTNARSSGDGGRSLTLSMGIAFMFQSALGLGPSKDNVCTATTPLSQAIVACLSKGPFGLGDEVNKTNATIVMAASRGDGYILQPTRTITPIDRTFSGASSINGGQVWVADTHLSGFNRPWFNVLGWGVDQDLPLIPSDFYSEALYADAADSKWDGQLGYHYYYDWYLLYSVFTFVQTARKFENRSGWNSHCF